MRLARELAAAVTLMTLGCGGDDSAAPPDGSVADGTIRDAKGDPLFPSPLPTSPMVMGEEKSRPVIAREIPSFFSSPTNVGEAGRGLARQARHNVKIEMRPMVRRLRGEVGRGAKRVTPVPPRGSYRFSRVTE